jgi:hypothetical protein
MINVKKRSGLKEEFNKEKLKLSLFRSGLKEQDCHNIVDHIEKKCFDGISTRKISQTAQRLMPRKELVVRANYGLKKAIQNIGPSGFPFEKLVCQLMHAKGYITQINQTLFGACVKHEVDVIARSPEVTYLIECKFHNGHRKKNDIKTALYVYARGLDLKANPKNDFTHFMLASNSALSLDALDYAKCVDLKVLCLNYPKITLYNEIQNHHLYPVTSLKKLKRSEQEILLKNDIITCKDIYNNPWTLHKFLNLAEFERNKVYLEVEYLLGKKII